MFLCLERRTPLGLPPTSKATARYSTLDAGAGENPDVAGSVVIRNYGTQRQHLGEPEEQDLCQSLKQGLIAPRWTAADEQPI